MFTRPVARRLGVLALTVLCAGGCGGKDDEDSGTIPDPTGTGSGGTGTGAGTAGTGSGTGTGSATGPGFARMVHLVDDVASLDVVLGDETAPLIAGVPNRTNTDVEDGYAGFPAAAYVVHGVDSQTGANLGTIQATVESGVYYTVIFYGDFADGTSAGWGHQDDLTPAPAGSHGLEVFHFVSGAAPVDLWFGGAEQVTGLAFGASSGRLEVPSGTVEVGLDVDADDVVDLTFSVPTADTATSHLYLMPTVDGSTIEALQHVQSQAMVVITAM